MYLMLTVLCMYVSPIRYFHTYVGVYNWPETASIHDVSLLHDLQAEDIGL